MDTNSSTTESTSTPPPSGDTNQTNTRPAVKIYFKKELVHNTLRLASTGKAAPFIAVHNDMGVLSLDESDPMVAELRDFNKKRRGGVVEIGLEEFEQLKKNQPFKRSVTPSAGPRLFRPDDLQDQFKPRFPTKQAELAPSAGGPENAKPAEVSNPAANAAVPAKSNLPFKPATSRASARARNAGAEQKLK